MAALSPHAMSILGMDGNDRRAADRRDDIVPGVIPPTPETRSARPMRRATSNYNVFQTQCTPANDLPPSYATATRHRAASVPSTTGCEQLPQYSSTVNAEAKVQMQIESINPLHGIAETDWRDVYVVVRGTLLSVYRARDVGPGRLLQSYTLQHAEIGLATDVSHTILTPLTRLAHLIPTAARRKAWSKDSSLFAAVKQSVLRLRVEADQLIFANPSEDLICDLINAISAGIDISHSLDERSIPRQCTVPRRRRRTQQPRIRNSGDLANPELVAEQERILREMFPTFAARRDQNRAASVTTETQRAGSGQEELQRTTTNQSVEERPNEGTQRQARDDDDLDLAVMREDFAAPGTTAPVQAATTSTARPPMSRSATDTSVASSMSDNMTYSTNPENFTTDGKWQPPHMRTAAQAQRYARRCMPVLHADAVRASDILIWHGRRVKINWRMELLEEWELSPPTYRSHGFHKAKKESDQAADRLERANSTSTNSQAASSDSPRHSRSALGSQAESGDQIQPVENGMANLELTKINSATKETPAPPRTSTTQSPQAEAKRQEVQNGEEIHGVVFCF
ncbi:hypothetical protein KC331_g16666 [Hortaea werneckii]|uniref:Uncharacterized protein n=1 Tax=Hortaea werneckii TaxID=91943 RepID=A0A3M7AVJ8_HORWE|nr:hypothetical protein KC331_g16666 [Hortaea werneckii]KAI7710701.1 hypothetical protein KC353_g9502 [Hortaea werneckii]RMY31471.1 hypothetical protein D0865_14991 [Hortaea werneckii]